jgi:hypothetical protein
MLQVAVTPTVTVTVTVVRRPGGAEPVIGYDLDPAPGLTTRAGRARAGPSHGHGGVRRR